MRKMCVIKKADLDDWVQTKQAECCPGADQRLELARHIASLHDLKGYPEGSLVTRLLPNGDVRVKTPEESMKWCGEEPEEEETAEPVLDASCPCNKCTDGLIGFLVGAAVVCVLVILWEVVTWV